MTRLTLPEAGYAQRFLSVAARTDRDDVSFTHCEDLVIPIVSLSSRRAAPGRQSRGRQCLAGLYATHPA